MRHAEVALVYNGVDFTVPIQPFLQGFQYDEAAEGSGDSLSITLSDVDLRWLNAWIPNPGDTLIAQLTQYDWAKPGDVATLNCGSMMVDSPSWKGPPDTVDLKALQIPANLGFSDTPQDTTWSDISIRQLAQEIAIKYNLTLQYLAPPPDIVIHALKRTKQTDADLLSATCLKYNLALKVYNSRIVIYSKMIAEQADPVVTITKGVTSIQDYELEAPLVGTNYAAVTILYKPVKVKTKYSYTFPPGVTSGKIMVFQQACDDDAQAELLAQGKLRAANEKAHTGTFVLVLNLNIVAGCVVTLKGWGATFDGNYFVDSCSHVYGKQAGSTTITVHKCLGGDY